MTLAFWIRSALIFWAVTLVRIHFLPIPLSVMLTFPTICAIGKVIRRDREALLLVLLDWGFGCRRAPRTVFCIARTLGRHDEYGLQ